MYCNAFTPTRALGLWHNGVLMPHKIRSGLKRQNSLWPFITFQLDQLGHFSCFPRFFFEGEEKRESQKEARE